MKDYRENSEKKTGQIIRKKRPLRRSSTVKMAVAWIILVLIALFFVQQRLSYIRTEKKVNRLLLEKRNIISSILPLKLEERYLTRFQVVEKIARETLNLQKPSRKQIIRLKVEPIEGKDN